MKKPVETPCALIVQKARLTSSDFAKIGEDVVESLRLAKERAAAGARLPVSRSDTAGGRHAPPLTNRGGKSEERRDVIGARLVMDDGKVLEIPARRTWGGSCAFIDWMNFTVDEADFSESFRGLSDEDVIKLASICLEFLFGFGITAKRDQGANFYQRSYVLGDGYGMVCHGGNKGTILVMLSGEGCDAAKDGWQHRVKHFLETRKSGRARLTRVDLAHDDYTGETYSVDKADQAYDDGLFTCGGRPPSHEYRGNWKRPDGKGRTIYIGNRKNGKFCRVYEKGRQLGDKNSEWVRIEVEYKSVDREIPFDILLEPGQYLAASYPAFGWISAVQERILTVQKKLQTTYDATIKNVKTQFGKALWVMLQIEKSAEKVLQNVMREGFPARLKLPHWQESPKPIHHYHETQVDRDYFDSMALA